MQYLKVEAQGNKEWCVICQMWCITISCCTTFPLNNLTVLFIDTLFEVGYAEEELEEEEGGWRLGRKEMMGFYCKMGIEWKMWSGLFHWVETKVNEFRSCYCQQRCLWISFHLPLSSPRRSVLIPDLLSLNFSLHMLKCQCSASCLTSFFFFFCISRLGKRTIVWELNGSEEDLGVCTQTGSVWFHTSIHSAYNAFAPLVSLAW